MKNDLVIYRNYEPIQSVSHGVIVNELGQQTIVNELDSHWVLYISGLVPT